MAKIMDNLKKFGPLVKQTYKEFSEREPFNNAIIIAYYTIFSLPGLLVILINVAGYFFDSATVTEKITSQIQGTMGGTTAKDVEQIVSQSQKSEGTTLASILGVATLLFGATGVFYQTQQILNKMWQVKPQPKKKFVKLIKDRVFSFGLILVIGFLLLVSLVLSAGLTALSAWMSANVSEGMVVLFKIVDILVSLGVVTLLFAAMYKFLPDAKIQWKDVWIGAVVTALLFVVAKFALGLYFGKSNPGSAYGAAGSIVLIMLWVSYAGMIFLFGAEFTQVYSNRFGHKVQPAEGAVSTKGENDNGAIVNKKTNNEARDKSKDPSGKKSDDRSPDSDGRTGGPGTTTVITTTTTTTRRLD
jgi:membrane protein